MLVVCLTNCNCSILEVKLARLTDVTRFGLKVLTAALPPARRTSRPHLAARGCVHATMPSVLCTTLLREGNLNGSTDAGGKMDEVD